MLKTVRAKVENYWTLTKKLLALMSVWGLIFSLVTIGRFGVAFDYDDTLVFSTPAFAKGFASSPQPFSPQFWAVVNQSYDVEEAKVIPCALAWAFRLFGFKVAIIAARPDSGGEALKKEWRRLVGKGQFIFAGDKSNKHKHLQGGNYVLYFGDSDSDMSEARKARVFSVRIRRSPKSTYKEDYAPGSLGELVIPFSEY